MIEEEILRLQIAVHDSHAVQVFDCADDLLEKSRSFLLVQSIFRQRVFFFRFDDRVRSVAR